MNVALDIPEKYYGSVKGMLNILLPDVDIVRAGKDDKVEITVKTTLQTEKGIKVTSLIQGEPELVEEMTDQEILAGSHTKDEFRKRCKARVKLSIYRLLCNYLKQPLSPWGILIGVRPTKIGHFLLDKGFSQKKIDYILADVYGIAQEKRDLLLKIVNKERQYLPSKKEAKKKVSIYLGIPFCPTRCAYCSFASYPFSSNQEYVADFLAALNYEIERLGKKVIDLGLQVDTLYFGGGTPTVLSAKELGDIISKLKKYFPLANLREFTVEAGRPDTITVDKLEVLKEAGVDRISINPQTMNQATLDKIGRHHTVEEVIDSFKLAREIGFKNINMDLIIGLPGEEIEDVENTLSEIKKLTPDSLTVHTLALKRAAKLDKETKLPTASKVKEMLVLTKKAAKELELIPYYMYRQKYMLGNLQNIGYAKSGLESIYNILMMEERQTVIGLGGGSITKLVDPQDWSLEREINPKLPDQYIRELENRTDRKIAKLTSLVK
ncbi:coproporphyrinogen III oxidase [Halanaerocella petrolearia]